jgi:hypothetical protein
LYFAHLFKRCYYIYILSYHIYIYLFTYILTYHICSLCGGCPLTNRIVNLRKGRRKANKIEHQQYMHGVALYRHLLKRRFVYLFLCETIPYIRFLAENARCTSTIVLASVHHRSVPSPRGRLATIDRHSTLFLDLMVFTAKVFPVHLLMLFVCLCYFYLESGISYI